MNIATKAPEACIGFSLRKADRVITQIYDHHLASCGIKVTQYSILRAIHYLGTSTSAQLQEVMILDQTTLSRNLKPLARDGYIHLAPGEDKRARVVSLTESGKALYDQAQQLWKKAQTGLTAQLSPEAVQQLVALSNEIVKLRDCSTLQVNKKSRSSKA